MAFSPSAQEGVDLTSTLSAWQCQEVCLTVCKYLYVSTLPLPARGAALLSPALSPERLYALEGVVVIVVVLWFTCYTSPITHPQQSQRITATSSSNEPLIHWSIFRIHADPIYTRKYVCLAHLFLFCCGLFSFFPHGYALTCFSPSQLPSCSLTSSQPQAVILLPPVPPPPHTHAHMHILTPSDSLFQCSQSCLMFQLWSGL